MAIVTDPNDLGTDVALLDDLAPVWGIVSGRTNLAYALARRFSTPRGSLHYDLEYGYDVVAWLNAALDITSASAQLASLQSSLGAEAQKEERIQDASATLTYDVLKKKLFIVIDGEDAEGPFGLVLSAGDVTVDVLSVDGVQVGASVTADSATVIVGPQGIQGIQGLPGATGGGGGGGTPQLILDDPRTLASSSGSEDVLYQWDGVDFGALAAGSLTGEIMASALSASGTATYRLRIGGSDGVADGTVICSFTHALASFQTKNASGSFANPTGLLYIKVTAQSSGAGVDAQLKGPVVTFR